jgi:hypothetical protein
METYELQVSRRVKTDAGLIYGVLADYRNEHPHILPKPYFQSIEVEQGGVGAGTVVRVKMKAMGVSTHLRLVVTEPKPGLELQEEDPAAGVTTTFRLEPDPVQGDCVVTIHLVWRKKKGLLGFLESKITPPVARKIFMQELDILKRYCEEKIDDTI